MKMNFLFFENQNSKKTKNELTESSCCSGKK